VDRVVGEALLDGWHPVVPGVNALLVKQLQVRAGDSGARESLLSHPPLDNRRHRTDVQALLLREFEPTGSHAMAAEFAA